MSLSILNPYTTLSTYGTSANSTSANNLIDLQPSISAWDMDNDPIYIISKDVIIDHNVELFDINFKQSGGSFAFDINRDSILHNVGVDIEVNTDIENSFVFKTNSNTVSGGQITISTNTSSLFVSAGFVNMNDFSDVEYSFNRNPNIRLFKDISPDSVIRNSKFIVNNVNNLTLFENSNDVTIENLTITGNVKSVYITEDDSDNITIDNLVIDDTIGIIFNKNFETKAIFSNGTATYELTPATSIWKTKTTTGGSSYKGITHNNTIYLQYGDDVYLYNPILLAQYILQGSMTISITCWTGATVGQVYRELIHYFYSGATTTTKIVNVFNVYTNTEYLAPNFDHNGATSSYIISCGTLYNTSYLVGGSTNLSISSYNLDTYASIQLNYSPQASNSVTYPFLYAFLHFYDNKMYKLGDRYSDLIADMYDPALDSWSVLPNLPTGISDPDSHIRFNNIIYVMGAIDYSYYYDIITETYTKTYGNAILVTSTGINTTYN